MRRDLEKTADWFEKLTGFREIGYEETRARLTVDGGKLVLSDQWRELWDRRA